MKREAKIFAGTREERAVVNRVDYQKHKLQRKEAGIPKKEAAVAAIAAANGGKGYTGLGSPTHQLQLWVA